MKRWLWRNGEVLGGLMMLPGIIWVSGVAALAYTRAWWNYPLSTAAWTAGGLCFCGFLLVAYIKSNE